MTTCDPSQPDPASVAFMDQYASEIGSRLDVIISAASDLIRNGEDPTIVFANFITKFVDENLSSRVAGAILASAVIRLAQQQGNRP